MGYRNRVLGRVVKRLKENTGVNFMKILAKAEIRHRLQEHQARLRLGEKVPSLAEVARRAGRHRDTIFACIAGDQIDEITQIRLSKVLHELAQAPPAPTRLMHISVAPNGVKLGFGLGVGVGRR
jgi:hypothetical protein